MIDVLWSILDALFYPPLCRLGFHRWETPPFQHMFVMFPQHRDYQQYTRFGCWKKRYVEEGAEMTIFGLPVVKTGARMITEEQRKTLCDIWVALKGVSVGAPLDTDYAKELADKLDEIIK